MTIEDAMSRYARGNSIARALIAYRASKTRLRETTVEQGMKETKADRWPVMQALKSLAQAGAGRFIIGRAGYKTRIEWAEGVDYKTVAHTVEQPELFDADDEVGVTTADCEDAVSKARAALASVYNTTPDKVRITVEV